VTVGITRAGDEPHAVGAFHGIAPTIRMPYDPDTQHRRSIRLQGYDYSQAGAYYVAICVECHQCLLGEIQLGQMRQNDAGRMVDQVWRSILARFPTTELDEYVVMPNHFHGILKIVGAPRDVGAALVATQGAPAKRAAAKRAPTRGAPTLGDMIGAFKSITTDEYVSGVQQAAWPRFRRRFWQRNFYEHIVRDEDELGKIRDYIRQNPVMWAVDRYNPDRGVPVVDGEARVVPWEDS